MGKSERVENINFAALVIFTQAAAAMVK